MSQRDIRGRIRILRENRDKGWRDALATEIGRMAIWELYEACMEQRDVVRDLNGAASVPDTFRALGKQAIGNWLANRCMLADHKGWLLVLAENQSPLDDGRAQDKQQADADEQEIA